MNSLTASFGIFQVRPFRYPLYKRLIYTYDGFGHLIEIYDETTEQAVVSYVYDSLGNRTLETIHSTDSTKDKSTYTYYDNIGRLIKVGIRNADGTNTPLETYTYQANLGKTTHTILGSDGAPTQVETTYTDYLGNCIQETSAYTAALGGTYTTQYEYDHLGNVVKTTDSLGNVTENTYNWTGNLLQSEDAKGNVTHYTYDKLGRLIKITSPIDGTNSRVVKYYYDSASDRRRFRKSKSMGDVSTTYVWDGDQLVLEITGDTVRKYIRGLTLAACVTGNAPVYYQYDGHGSVVQLTDATGAVLKNYDYDAFGNHIVQSYNDANPFRYSGEYFDDETDLYYLRARYYWPSLGQFTQEDPHWNPGNMVYGDSPTALSRGLVNSSSECYLPSPMAMMQSGNLYAYCGNNPILYVDPTGNVFMLVTAGIGAIIGGISGAIYSHTQFGEVQWQGVATGATIGGALGLTGGAAAGLIFAGSATASTGTVLTGMGITGATATGGTGIAVTQATQKLAPELGNKLNYVFGQATGSLHNIQRSTDMLRQLNRIGIVDNDAGRAYVAQKITEAYYNAEPIAQEGARYIKEIVLMGPIGGAKMETIWEGAKLITVKILGG